MAKLFETLTVENWGKYWTPAEPDRGCLAFHLHRVIQTASWRESRELRHRIAEAITSLYPERVDPSLPPNSYMGMGAFVDHPDTTLDDVIRVCKTADV